MKVVEGNRGQLRVFEGSLGQSRAVGDMIEGRLRAVFYRAGRLRVLVFYKAWLKGGLKAFYRGGSIL